MKKDRKKILSLVLLIVLLAGLFVLSISINSNEVKPFQKIRISGNILFSANDYLKYLKLDNNKEYSLLNPKIVRDRFQKHPYINHLEVSQSGDELEIKIVEKNINAILVIDSLQLLVTEDCQLIPYLENTSSLDCPLIVNPKIEKKVTIMKSCLNQKDLIDALKIIDVIKNSNEKLLSLMSEIDLRDGKDIIITLEGSNYPIIIGRKKIIDKSFYLSNSFDYLTNKSLNGLINYVDLRFNNMLVFGFNDSLLVSRENKI